MDYQPPRSACFRPDDYRDLRLFADRAEDTDDLVSRLDSYLVPDSPNDAHLLVRGQRGVGKSILVRRVLDLVQQKRDVLIAEVDCAVVGVGPENVLRKLARKLADEAIQNALDERLRTEANLLGRLTDATKVKAREVRTWSEQLRLSAAAAYKFADTVSFEFGMSRVAGKSREIEESSDRNVDAPFLQLLIADFLVDCARAEQKVILFVDNLDQAAVPERKEDVERVTDVVRFLAGLRDAVVVMTLRTEFVSRDLLKLCPSNVEIPPMDAEGLCEVAKVRMRHAGAEQRTKLKGAGFERLAKDLSQWTGNPWGFLSWLHHLDYYRKVDLRSADAATVVQALQPGVKMLYPGVKEADLRTLAKGFAGAPDDLRTAEELTASGITPALLDHAVAYGALIPDWLLDPHGYYLPPQLHFLAR